MVQWALFNPTGKVSSAHKWKETYVFLMHEDTGIGPKLAARFVELVGSK